MTYEWNNHPNPLNHKDHEHMITHGPNGPRCMDESRINASTNHNGSRTINGTKANAPIQTWIQRPKICVFDRLRTNGVYKWYKT